MNQISVKLNFQIKTYDIDIAGHVNNNVYIKWFEDLRTKLFNEYFHLPELLSKNIYPVVVSTEIHYKKFLKLFDKPIGVLCIEYCDHGIITLKSEISLNGKIAAGGKQKCALFDLNKSKVINGKSFQKLIGQDVGLITSNRVDYKIVSVDSIERSFSKSDSMT